jgi:chaperonin GroEL
LSTNSPGASSLPASPDTKPFPTANFDQDLGVSIIIRWALMHPACTILNNAGEAAVIVGTQYGAPDQLAWGYDAQNGAYVDTIRAGIVDPLKVVRTALVDAAGVVSLLTMSEACVVDAPKED